MIMTVVVPSEVLAAVVVLASEMPVVVVVLGLDVRVSVVVLASEMLGTVLVFDNRLVPRLNRCRAVKWSMLYGSIDNCSL